MKSRGGDGRAGGKTGFVVANVEDAGPVMGAAGASTDSG